MNRSGEFSMEVDYPADWPVEWETEPIPGGEPGDRIMQVVVPRSWRQRLLSWPWRPWHNVEVTEIRVTLRESNVDMERGTVEAAFVVVGEPTYVCRTARQPKPKPDPPEMP